jgi:hypothetical protein
VRPLGSRVAVAEVLMGVVVAGAVRVARAHVWMVLKGGGTVRVAVADVRSGHGPIGENCMGSTSAAGQT